MADILADTEYLERLTAQLERPDQIFVKTVKGGVPTKCRLDEVPDETFVDFLKGCMAGRIVPLREIK